VILDHVARFLEGRQKRKTLVNPKLRLVLSMRIKEVVMAQAFAPLAVLTLRMNTIPKLQLILEPR
jgi:hypothetical protein